MKNKTEKRRADVRQEYDLSKLEVGVRGKTSPFVAPERTSYCSRRTGSESIIQKLKL